MTNNDKTFISSPIVNPMEALLINSLITELQKISGKLDKITAYREEIVPYEEAMTILKCSRSTLDRMRSEGIIKAYRIKGLLYLKYSELVQVLEKNPVEADEAKAA